MRTSRLIAAVGATALAGTATAQYMPAIGDGISVPGTPYVVDISGGTVGQSYNAFTLSVDWSVVAGNPWSQEAFLTLNGAGDGSGTAYLAGTFADNGAANGDPITLTWSGSLDTDYIGGDSLFFGANQLYSSTYQAAWSNISLTLIEGASAVFVLSDTETNNVAANGFNIYDLVIDANGTDVSIDTFGTAAFGNNDTELFLLDTDGTTLLATSDDDGGMGLLSQIETTLDAGTYTVVVGGFNSTYGGGGVGDFASTDADSGDVTVNVSTISGTGANLTLVPEPGSLALLGLGGLMVARRRRA